jgi:hypothetical protein
VVVDTHGIAEQGHHDELVELDGMYKRLHQAQFGWQPLAEDLDADPLASEARARTIAVAD